MIRRILAITVKELLQLKRDWRTAVALLGMPVILLLIYGYALSFDVQDIRLAVVDLSRTARLARGGRGVPRRAATSCPSRALDGTRALDAAVRLRRAPRRRW